MMAPAWHDPIPVTIPALRGATIMKCLCAFVVACGCLCAPGSFLSARGEEGLHKHCRAVCAEEQGNCIAR
jgi:hypothetical protein